jgi:DNA-directed RNA polymerase sigma subunit (sigma70/sigma32)
LRALADQGRAIRLPGHVVDFLGTIARAERALAANLDRQPTVDELAQYLEVEPGRIVEARQAARSPVSLETPLGGEDDELTLGILVDDAAAGEAVPGSCEAAELSARLESALGELLPAVRSFGCTLGSITDQSIRSESGATSLVSAARAFVNSRQQG